VLYNEQRQVCALIYLQYLVLFHHDIEIIKNDDAVFLTIFLEIKVYVNLKREWKNDTGRWEVIFDPILLIHIVAKLHNWLYIKYLDMRNPVNIS
jgi:hypothetical protein